MGDLKRFVPKDELIAKAKAEEARQTILDLGLPQSATEDMMITIARHENGGKLVNWRFVMLSPQQCLAVWDAIEELPKDKRPHDVDRVFKLVITHIETNTGIVTLTREELAAKVGIRPQEVSKAMGALEEMGVITRERWKLPGMRGSGTAKYRVNSHVAWNGKLTIREEKSKQESLPFELIQGGKE